MSHKGNFSWLESNERLWRLWQQQGAIIEPEANVGSVDPIIDRWMNSPRVYDYEKETW